MSDLYGYEQRKQLFPGEDAYFKSNQHVAGMAAEDGKVILNPYSQLKPEELQAVAKNEAIRLFMRENEIVPPIELTPEQEAYFRGTEYESADAEKRQTIIARILSGDPSAKATKEQVKFANDLMRSIADRDMQSGYKAVRGNR